MCHMTSSVGQTQHNSCLKPVGNNLVHHEPFFKNETDVTLPLLAVIMYLKWSSVNILYEQDTEYEAMQLHYRLSNVGTFAVMYDLEEMSLEKIDTLLSLISHSHDEFVLNVTILCRLESCMKYIAKPFDYSRKHNVRSALVYQSRWLLGIFHDGDLSSMETNCTEFDNVVVIQYPTSFLKNNPVQNNIKYDSSEVCMWISINTLMWTKERKRRMSIVGYTQITGSLYTQQEIFPNVRMGFNGQRLKISTLPWPAFVIFDNKTGKYSGLTIDLLQELAQRLNFTYDITNPSDKQWGVDQNGSYTGLVGQLQSLEVDMVAAPLMIDTEREKVMDFAQPFFYESTAIFFKKPDSNSTKWRTLIDPFSTTVFICIIIALVVLSLFLFFIEKSSAYFFKEKDRTKVHGLHHFTDSFWYMYGALLLQGGEHMAASASGKVLLSSWWIFCIIVMATYSGNLVAFLTTTKDKLPFNNIAELVAQDDFTWGIQGGTSFTTLFKNSKEPDFQKFWTKLIEFNQTDPMVLSKDIDVHMEKVQKGKHAHVGDKTLMEFKTLNNCDLGISLTEFLPFQYSIGLPNNSPYTKIFSGEFPNLDVNFRRKLLINDLSRMPANWVIINVFELMLCGLIKFSMLLFISFFEKKNLAPRFDIRIMKMHESGLLKVWQNNHWPKQAVCKRSLITDAKPITLIDVHSAFYIIAIGIFIGIIPLCVEFLKHKYCKWKKRRTELE